VVIAIAVRGSSVGSLGVLEFSGDLSYPPLLGYRAYTSIEPSIYHEISPPAPNSGGVRQLKVPQNWGVETADLCMHGSILGGELIHLSTYSLPKAYPQLGH
jgi:hypothetical protein